MKTFKVKSTYRAEFELLLENREVDYMAGSMRFTTPFYIDNTKRKDWTAYYPIDVLTKDQELMLLLTLATEHMCYRD